MRLWFTFVLLSFTPFLHAQPVYEVVSKKGFVAIKGPMDTEWRPLKAKSIPIGSLIRTDLGSRIEISLKMDGEKVDRKVRIIQPMITRLDEDLIRKMETRPYPLKAIWDHGPEAKKEIKDTPLLSFASSFFRSIVTLDKSLELPQVKDETSEEESVQIGAKFLPIEILSPGDDAFFFLEGQTKIPLIWNPPKDGLTYRIYVWQEDEVRTSPVVSQKETWYTLVLNKSGRYKLQIEDAKHQYRSEAISFTVDKSLSSTDHSKTAESDALALEYPLARAVILGKSVERIQRFSWSDDKELKAGERYRLTLQIKGRAPIQKETRSFSESVKIKTGQYTWFVEKVSKGATVKSRSRDLNYESKSLDSLAKTAGQTIILDFD
ncbi:MAG: hypothetical protein V4655_08815 [Bdellovibrionota bacterium]|nr:MAG: hypothetical protein EOP10_14920 [Pseudomonadota bacterium]